MSVPAGFWTLPPFDTVAGADQPTLAAAAVEVPFNVDEVHQLDEDHVAVLFSGTAVLHRFADTERLVKGPLVLDVLSPGPGRPARFHTLDSGTLVWIPRTQVDALCSVPARLDAALAQNRDERADLAALADRQTWVGPPGPASLTNDPYVGELDYVIVALPGALAELVPVLPGGCTPVFSDGRVLLVFGTHGPSSLFSGHNPPAQGGHGMALVPVEWNGVRGLYAATVWTGQLMYVHVVRELYGLLARSGQVYDPGLPKPERLMCWERRLRLRCRWNIGSIPSLSDWEAMTGVPWDPTRLPLMWRFRRHSFGVGPRFDRGCDGHMQLGLLNFEQLHGAAIESLDGLTLAAPAAPLYAFHLQADFRMADPSPLDSSFLARAAAWLVG